MRVSIGIENDEEDVKHLILILNRIARKDRSHLDKFIGSIDNGTFFIPQTKTEKQINDFIEARTKKVYSISAQ
ncbi:MAG: hypothetical protein ACFFCQ_06830 [Promethearchaeota archaeon]